MQLKTIEQIFLLFTFTFLFTINADGKIERLRCMWRADPTTTMVIGWDQTAGTNPVLFYTTKNKGGKMEAYGKAQKPDRVIAIKGMNNHFVRLKNLKPETTYYFKIKDSQGSSPVYSFHLLGHHLFRSSLLYFYTLLGHHSIRSSKNFVKKE